MKMNKSIQITIQCEDDEEMGDILSIIVSQIKEGYVEGCNSNETSSYHFSVKNVED